MTTPKSEQIRVPMSAGSGDIAVTRRLGNGPEVLMVHGIGSSSADFNPVLEAMTEFSRPITMDLRGHGASSKPENGYHYSDYVRDLQAVIEGLELTSPIILGHSLGGIVTLMWASQHPDAARAIVIEDSPLRSGEDFREAFDSWLTLNALPQEAARAWYAGKNPGWSDTLLDQRSFDMVNTSRQAILELQKASLANEGLDSFAGLSSISAPLLFLQGDIATGSMVQPEDLAFLQRQIPHMGVKHFPGASHTIHRSHPEEWLETVREFIAGLA